MELQELLKKVRQIEIKTKKLSLELFSGNYASTFKGKGMSFSEVRKYTYGDDIRNIDWNVTSRSGEPHIKEYEEERELTFLLIIDCSDSMKMGNNEISKSLFTTEIAATLAFSSLKNNDKVGVIFFSDRIEKYIPPKKGRGHILRIIRELLETKSNSNGSDIGEALRFLQNTIRKRTVSFLISDFIESKPFEKELSLIANRHQMFGLRIESSYERNFPNLGLIKLYNPENGSYTWIDSSNNTHFMEEFLDNNANEIHKTFSKQGMKFAHLSSEKPFVPILSRMFEK